LSASGIVIRPVLPGEEGALCELVRELAEYEKLLEGCKATPASLREALFGYDAIVHALFAHADGELAGMAIWFENYSTFRAAKVVHLHDLFVRPAFRKRGIGTALLAHLARICEERKSPRLEWIVLDWNELALSRYRKLGAKVLDEWRIMGIEGAPLRDLAAMKARAPEARPPAPSKKEASKKDATKRVVIHTDGGCVPNPGVGAWAAVLRHGDLARELVGGEADTTNNRMELMAAISALEALKEPCAVEMHTDSQYVKKGLTEWLAGWKKKGWKTAGKTPVKNVDLWQRLDAAASRHDIDWRWVRGHSGNVDNERCDVLCAREIERISRGGR